MGEELVEREPGAISRRRVIIGTAWATPAIVLAVAVPKAAASETEPELQGEPVYGDVLDVSAPETRVTDGVTVVSFIAQLNDLPGENTGWHGQAPSFDTPLHVNWKLELRDSGGALLETKRSSSPFDLYSFFYEESDDDHSSQREIDTSFVTPLPAGGKVMVTLTSVAFAETIDGVTYVYYTTSVSNFLDIPV